MHACTCTHIHTKKYHTVALYEMKVYSRFHLLFLKGINAIWNFISGCWQFITNWFRRGWFRRGFTQPWSKTLTYIGPPPPGKKYYPCISSVNIFPCPITEIWCRTWSTLCSMSGMTGFMTTLTQELISLVRTFQYCTVVFWLEICCCCEHWFIFTSFFCSSAQWM